MSMNFAIQLSFELASAFPIRTAVEAAGAQILRLARDLRKSGSDLVVEEDLAEIFGRGRVVQQLEVAFKDAVKIEKFIPLFSGSEVRLDSGPGPTIHRALLNSRYLSTVIQLSLLAEIHNREYLGIILGDAMTKRFEMRVPGSSPDPGHGGITGTLAACSSQTSAFNWSYFVRQVEVKLRQSMPAYHHSPDYLKLSPSLLQGAMDYLYLVQSLPDHRKITVSNEMGSITLTIWAHYILGLTVALTDAPGGNIIFGDEKVSPHVIITWSKENKESAGDLFWPIETEDEEPIIRLLDQKLDVLLEVHPEEGRRFNGFAVEDRHPILGYGTVYLQRVLNTSHITSNNDPIYEESVKLITALALHASTRLDRDTNLQHHAKSATKSGPTPGVSLEFWRVLKSARMLFDGIKIDSTGVNSYASFFLCKTLDETSCPNSFHAFLSRVKIGDSEISPAKRLIQQVNHLAHIVLIFAHVSDLDNCGEMPIRLTEDVVSGAAEIAEVCKGPNERAKLGSSVIFHAVSELLSGTVLNVRDDLPQFSSRLRHFLVLCSDFGWSVFLDTVGSRDPAKIRPELVHVQKGTPTHAKTNERKPRIRDGVGCITKFYPDIYPLESGTEYIPRCAAKVTREAQYWTSRTPEFETTLFCMIEPSPEWRNFEGAHSFEEFIGFREMHDCVWQTHLTPSCEHPGQNTPKRPIKLGPDATALIGWSTAGEILRPFPERIVICLTRGDARIRWLAVISGVTGRRTLPSSREVMLRTQNCCDECALKHVAAQVGKWILIL